MKAIPLRHVQTLLSALLEVSYANAHSPIPPIFYSQKMDAARRALNESLGGQRKTSSLKRKSAARKRTKAAQTRGLREQLLLRARECEAMCGRALPGKFDPGSMDHFFGKAKVPQALSNVWLLCIHCNRAKTDNVPTSDHWLRLFIQHCNRHGYAAEADRARARLEAESLLQAAESVGAP